MPFLPPHLIEEEGWEQDMLQPDFRNIGRQGPSKYGKWWARLHKALSRKKRAKK